MTNCGRLRRNGDVASLVGLMNRIGDDSKSDPQLTSKQQTRACRDSALRVLFAVDSRFPGLGGAENQALKLACALRERGIVVEFVTPRVLPSQAMTETVQGFTVNRIDYPHIRWLGSLVLMAYFARYLLSNRHRFDAVHIHITHLLAAAAGFVRPWIGMSVITKISGFYEFEGGVLDQRTRWMPLNFVIRRGLRKVDHIQTISQQTREKLLQAGFSKDQIKFVPNGIEIGSPPMSATDTGTTTIGYCGRLRAVKGVHVLLDGFAQVLESRPDQKIRLIIAGSGETLDELQAQAENLGIVEHIDWLGLIENTEQFFQQLDIYVQPSFAEGLPNSVMEAMIEQRPVVASNIGGNNDLIKHDVSGLLFNVGDSSSLAQQLIRFLDDPGLRESTAQTGRQVIVEHYGFDQVVEQLSELYRA